MIDSHCHLADKAFDPDRVDVIGRALSAGVDRMVCIADSIEEGERCREIAGKFENVFWTMGVHPHVSDQWKVESGQCVRDAFKDPKCKAVGEIGLDRWVKKDEVFALVRVTGPAGAERAAVGHLAKKAVVPGRWHTHPEMAAAGLWTTPSDLALFAIDLSNSYAGKEGKLLAQDTVRRMLTVEKGTYALGLALKGEGDSLAFSHGGANVGYRCLLVAHPMTGQGLAIMTNSDTGGAMFNDLVKLAGELYAWPQSKP